MAYFATLHFPFSVSFFLFSVSHFRISFPIFNRPFSISHFHCPFFRFPSDLISLIFLLVKSTGVFPTPWWRDGGVDRQLLLCLPVLFVQSWKAHCLVDVRTQARFAVHWVSEWYCKYPFFSLMGLLWVSVAEWWKLRTWNPAIARSSLAYPDEIVLELFQCSAAFLNNWFAFRELEFLNLEGTRKLDGFSSQLEILV